MCFCSCFHQEHHFEIASRTIAYIDVSPRALRGNETLHVHSSPILYSVARKAISRVIHGDSHQSQFNPSEHGGWRNKTPLYFSSLPTSDEPGFAFLGNLGIPFIRICLSNNPKVGNWILHTFSTLSSISISLPNLFALLNLLYFHTNFISNNTTQKVNY